MRKVKLNEAGQPCRHCETPVVRSEHKAPPKYKAGGYWFTWWLTCPNCKAMFMQPSAQVWFDGKPPAVISSKFARIAAGKAAVEAGIAAMLRQA